MPLYKEINLDFADEQQMENGKRWGKNGRKFSTLQKQAIPKDNENEDDDSPLRAKIFEVIKEQEEKSSIQRSRVDKSDNFESKH